VQHLVAGVVDFFITRIIHHHIVMSFCQPPRCSAPSAVRELTAENAEGRGGVVEIITALHSAWRACRYRRGPSTDSSPRR
jgi:hypothetical protein